MRKEKPKGTNIPKRGVEKSKSTSTQTTLETTKISKRTGHGKIDVMGQIKDELDRKINKLLNQLKDKISKDTETALSRIINEISEKINSELLNRITEEVDKKMDNLLRQIENKKDKGRKEKSEINKKIEEIHKKILMEYDQKAKENFLKDLLTTLSDVEGSFILPHIFQIIEWYKMEKIKIEDPEIIKKCSAYASHIINFLSKYNIEIVGEVGEIASYKEFEKRGFELTLIEKINSSTDLVRIIMPGFKYQGKFFINVLAEPVIK